MRISPRQSIKFLKSQNAGKMIGYLCLMIGVIAFLYAAKVKLDERSVKNWLPHFAQIERAALTTHVNDEGVETYLIDVGYKFDWDGQIYAGNRYRLHDNSSSNFDENNLIVQDLLQTKEEGGRYPIFVNPKNPRQSAVKNTIPAGAKSSGLFLGFFFSLIGCFTAFKPRFFGKSSKRRSSNFDD